MEKLYIKELVSFLTVRRDVRDEEKQGRTSGSVEWRRRRGELGETASEEVTTSTLSTTYNLSAGVVSDIKTRVEIKYFKIHVNIRVL